MYGCAQVTVTNTGKMDADDVVLGFMVPPGAGVDGVPLQTLFGLTRARARGPIRFRLPVPYQHAVGVVAELACARVNLYSFSVVFYQYRTIGVVKLACMASSVLGSCFLTQMRCADILLP